MMKTTIHMEFTPDGVRYQRESFGIPHSCKKIHIDAKISAALNNCGFLAVYDETGKLRFQRLLSDKKQVLGIGLRAEDTSVGGVAGAVNEGQWNLVYGITSADLKKNGAGTNLTVTFEISDEEVDITEPLHSLWTTAEDDFRYRVQRENFQRRSAHTPAHGGSPCEWRQENANGDFQRRSAHTLVHGGSPCEWRQENANGDFQRRSAHTPAHGGSPCAWRKGDFHTHTTLSDGKDSPLAAMKKALDMQMDFYVPTEHNLVHTGWVDTDLLIVPGVEITTPLGHFNLFGITERPKGIDALMMAATQTEMENVMEKLIEEAGANGWLISINHPFLTEWQWLLNRVELSKVQCLEIINDPTYPAAPHANDSAISFLDALWQEGYRIYGVGGSDAHNLTEERYEGATEPSIVGDPGTYVCCDELTADALLKNVRKGHMVVTRHCRVNPHIYGETDEYLPGDEIKERQIVYELEIFGLRDYPQVCLMVGEGSGSVIKAPQQVIKQADGRFLVSRKIRMGQGAWKWVRMEVRDADGKFLAYVNPVYAGIKEPELLTYGEVKQKWEGGIDCGRNNIETCI